MSWRRRILKAAIILLPVGVLLNVGLALGGADRGLVRAVARVPWRFLALPLGLAAVPWLTGALRLVIWLRFLGHRITLRESVRVNIASDLGAAVAPTAVAGGLVKWTILAGRGVPPGVAASLAAFTALEDIAFLLVAIPLALFLSSVAWRPRALDAAAAEAIVLPRGLIALAALAAVVLLALVVTRRGWGRPLARLVDRALVRVREGWTDVRRVFPEIFRRGRGRLVASFGLTAVQWTCRYSVPAVLLVLLGVPVDPFLSFALAGLVFAVTAVVPTPGAAGGAEAAFLLLYGTHVPRGVVGLLTASWRLVTYYLHLALGAVMFVALDRRSRA